MNHPSSPVLFTNSHSYVVASVLLATINKQEVDTSCVGWGSTPGRLSPSDLKPCLILKPDPVDRCGTDALCSAQMLGGALLNLWVKVGGVLAESPEVWVRSSRNLGHTPSSDYTPAIASMKAAETNLDRY